MGLSKRLAPSTAGRDADCRRNRAAVQTSSDDGGHPAPARAHHSKGLSSICALKGFEWTGVGECFRPLTLAISKSSSVWSPDQEREALPVAGNEKGPLSIARRRKR